MTKMSKQYWINFVSKLRLKMKVPPCRDVPIPSDYISVNVYNLAKLISTDAIVRMYFQSAINEALIEHPESLTSIEEMLASIDISILSSPEYNETDLVGFPINTLLNWLMGSPSGSKVFTDPKVNSLLKDILNEWGEFLKSPASLGDSENTVFNNLNGWCSIFATEKLGMSQFLTNEQLAIWEMGYLGDPLLFPYKSWNDFFIRVFKDGSQRPVETIPGTIASPCESKIFAIKDHVNITDNFWIKSQPYSVQELIGFPTTEDPKEHYDNYISRYQDGLVYQAFLAATKYHRWNSPLSGKIVKAYNLDGTYYAADMEMGYDPSSPDLSQGYIAHMAARCVIVIDTTGEDTDLGLVTFVGIGMSEVSSCIIDENITQGLEVGPVSVTRGQEIGRFQYGGSTSCLIFEPNSVDINSFVKNVGDDIKVGEKIYEANPVNNSN